MSYYFLVKLLQTNTLCNTQKHVFFISKFRSFFAKIYVFFYVFFEKS